MEAVKPKSKKKARQREKGVADKTAPLEDVVVHDSPTSSSISTDVERQIMDAAREDSSVGSSFTRLSLGDLCETNSGDQQETEMKEWTTSSLESGWNVVRSAETRIATKDVQKPPEHAIARTISSVSIATTTASNRSESIVEYLNPELEENSLFEHHFNETQKVPQQQNRIADFLCSYIVSRKQLAIFDQKIVGTKNQADALQTDLWIMERVMVTEGGECQDGNPVSANVSSELANFSHVNFAQLKQVLMELKSQAHDRVNIAYDCGVAQQRIIALLAHALDPCIGNMDRGDLLQLRMGIHVSTDITLLRNYVGVLFHFLRIHQDDSEFLSELQEWLTRMVGLIVRYGTHRDHLFILHHILRCPPGLEDWLVRLVQVPFSPDTRGMPLTDPLIVHAIAILGVILKPITQRDTFLDKPTSAAGNSWVVLEVDSDGTALDANLMSAITEEDLIKLLNQVPLKHLFQEIYNINSYRLQDGSQVYGLASDEDFSYTRMKELVGISVFLVGLLDEGLRTYNSVRYKQFAKRLCCYICHIVKHITDIREHYRHLLDERPSEWAELQEQYDVLFERATGVIFSSRHLGAWQFLTSLPYGSVSETCLWSLYYKLHQTTGEDFTNTVPVQEVMDANLIKMFLELKEFVAADEVYYLLSTYAAMALECGNANNPFVKLVTVNLVMIGVICEETKESCMKSVRSLLSNITREMPSLLSIILITIEKDFDRACEDSLYIFHGLPLLQWHLLPIDLDILARWLIHTNLLSLGHNLARYIIMHLNYGFSNDRLILDHEIHCRIATMIVEAVMRHAPEQVAAGTMATVSSYVRSQASESALKIWAWDMILRLRLHRCDRYCFAQLDLNSVPDLYDDPQLEVVSRGVLSTQPLACYVATLMTSWGHSVPEICARGFVQLDLAARYGKYTAAIAALQHVVPLFAESPESLAKSDKFLSLMVYLLAADKTYLKMARNLIAPEFPGQYLQKLCCMVQYQLLNHVAFNMSSPAPLVAAWLNSLLRLPNWATEPTIIYLMDQILSATAGNELAVFKAREVLMFYYETCSTGPHVGASGGPMGSIIGWISPTYIYGKSLLTTQSNANATWFAALAIEMDENAQENVWTNTLVLLYNGDQSTVDAALKKAASVCREGVPATHSLAIYRWAQQALVTPMGHPLQSYVWQRFFTLFLARVVSPDRATTQGGVGNKFFEGKSSGLVKTMKSRLKETEEYYNNQSKLPNSSADGIEEAQDCTGKSALNMNEWYNTVKRLFQTYQLWIDEPRLFDRNLQLHTLPMVYEPRKLGLVFAGRKEMWMEYLNVASMNVAHQSVISSWENSLHRSVDRSNQVLSRSEAYVKRPLENLVARLQSYDQPLPPPVMELKPYDLFSFADEFVRFNQVVDEWTKESMEVTALEKAVGNFVEQCFTVLKESTVVLTAEARRLELNMSHHAALNCSYLELVTQLFRNAARETVVHAVCKSSPTHLGQEHHETCAGAASIRIVVNEAHIDEGVEESINDNRAQFMQLFNESIELLDTAVGVAALQFHAFLHELTKCLEEVKTVDSPKKAAILSLGVESLYHVITLYSQDLACYPPTMHMFSVLLQSLATMFVCGDGSQTMRLLASMLAEERVLKVLSPCLMPSDVPSFKFVEMYVLTVDSLGVTKPDSCFVCLSKFDIVRWLREASPSIHQRSKLLEFIFKTLNNAGLKPPSNKLIVLEILRKHVMTLLRCTFPEHFGEILHFLLLGSASQTLPIELWYDFLNALMGSDVHISQDSSLAELKVLIHEFATSQSILQYALLVQTSQVLGQFFSTERQQFGLHGLYPKYRDYLLPMMAFINTVMNCLIIAMLNENRGSPTDALSPVIWPSLHVVFDPWTAPCHVDQSSRWIEQLSVNTTWLMPWTVADKGNASRVVGFFTELVQFILDTIPGSGNLLNYLWGWYATFFAQPNVPETVLSVIHLHLAELTWSMFIPTIADMDAMRKVLSEPLPSCHGLVGRIFLSVQWSRWMDKIMHDCDNETVATSHVCLLSSLVRLSAEKSIRQSCVELLTIVGKARSFSWNTVHALPYSQVLDHWVATCDAMGVLNLADAASNSIEAHIYALLAEAAHFGTRTPLLHPTVMHKRVLFVRASMNLLAQSSVHIRTKQLAATHKFVLNLLDNIEAIVTNREPGIQDVEDSSLMLKEILTYASHNNTVLAQVLGTVFRKWLEDKDSTCVAVKGLCRVVCNDLSSPSTVGNVLEAALEAHFKSQMRSGSVTPTWDTVSDLLSAPTAPGLEESLAAEGHYLSVYALLYKHQKTCNGNMDLVFESNTLRRLLELLKQREVEASMEAKLPLLWHVFLSTIQVQAQLGHVSPAVDNLRMLVNYLMELAAKKSDTWGFLGSIGFGKSATSSLSFRALCRVMAVYLLAQMPDENKTVALRLYEDDPGAVVPLVKVEHDPTTPNNDAKKGLRDLEQLAENKSHIELKPIIYEAVMLIKNSKNTLSDSTKVLSILANKFFHNLYLQSLK